MNHPNMATLTRPNCCDLFLVVEQDSAYECFLISDLTIFM